MKKSTVYFCQECGYESSKWLGQCPACKSWSTFVEEPVVKNSKGKAISLSENSKPVVFSEISLKDNERISTDIIELDRVLGGGIVPGSLCLIGGDPGIGKSTLLLQLCQKLSQKGKKVLYASGEESLSQIKMRANRIGDFNDNMSLMAETDLETIKSCTIKSKPEVLIIDSIQTMFNSEVSSAPGSVSQVRESTSVLMHLAKGTGTTIFIVGHVTKDGNVAGPRVLEHMVDTVLYFEGDRNAVYRILRAVKNRFGGTNEIGVFEMKSNGLNEVANPSKSLLEGRPLNAQGSIVSCSLEGTRPMLIEIQALVCTTNFGIPRRTTVGTDFNKVNLLMAILEKKIGLNLSNQDAYVNITGGIKMNEPAIDLAIAIAITSSMRDIIIPDDLVAFGEVGLSGEVRSVTLPNIRVREAKKLGFNTIILPKASKEAVGDINGIELIYVSTLIEAIKYIIKK